MRMAPIAPSPELAPYVRSYTFVEFDGASTSALLPASGVALALRYRGEARSAHGKLPDAALTGLRSTVRRLSTSAGGGVIVAAFREAGAARFFAAPMHELFERTVALGDVVPRGEAAEVSARVADARDDSTRVAAVEAFLRRRLSSARCDPLVERAAAEVRSSGGQLRIAALAERLGIGIDALEKRFRAVVGATPKQLASVVRVRRAVELHQRGASLTLAAFEAGYSDHSHFIREFRRVTGQAPRDFFRGTPFTGTRSSRGRATADTQRGDGARHD